MSSRSHRHYAILRARCLEPGNRHENADVDLIAVDQIQPGFRIAEDAGSEAVTPAATLPPCRSEESAAIKSLRPCASTIRLSPSLDLYSHVLEACRRMRSSALTPLCRRL
jgi:hypothetical protein